MSNATKGATKTNPGNFFEDFRLGQEIRHATPRTVTTAMWRCIRAYSARALPCSRRTPSRARSATAQAPLDDLLVFHVVFGKTVPDVSLNAVANLGYADCRFLKPVYAGATLNAVSEVIGLRENANRKTGIVYVRSRGFDETGDCVLDYVRWVMVRKRDENAPAPPKTVPELPKAVEPAQARRRLPEDRCGGLRHRAGRQPASLRRLQGRREDRPCRRHHGGRSRAHDRDAALSEHRAHPLQPFRRKQRPLRPPADLWRPRHFAGARAVVQRARQRLPCRGDQWRAARGAAIRRPHGVCLVGGAGDAPTCPAATTSARCVCAPSPPRTGPARISRSRPATITIRR